MPTAVTAPSDPDWDEERVHPRRWASEDMVPPWLLWAL